MLLGGGLMVGITVRLWMVASRWASQYASGRWPRGGPHSTPLGSGLVVGLTVRLWAVASRWASQYASGRWPHGGPHSTPLGGGLVVGLTVRLWAVASWWASQYTVQPVNLAGTISVGSCTSCRLTNHVLDLGLL